MLIRSAARFLPWCVCWILVLAWARPIQGEQNAHALDGFLPGYSVARCLFIDERLVLEKGEDLYVLRAGDAVPGQPTVRLLEIDERGATLVAAHQSVHGQTTPDRILRLIPKADGGLEILSMSSVGRQQHATHPDLQDAGFVVRQSDGTVRRIDSPVLSQDGGQDPVAAAPQHHDGSSTGGDEAAVAIAVADSSPGQQP